MKRYNTLTGIYSSEGRTVLYTKTEYFVRTSEGDVKFRTKGMAYDIANKLNKISGEIVAFAVTKIFNQKIGKYGEIIFENLEEISTSEETMKLLMLAKDEYPLKY